MHLMRMKMGRSWSVKSLRRIPLHRVASLFMTRSRAALVSLAVWLSNTKKMCSKSPKMSFVIGFSPNSESSRSRCPRRMPRQVPVVSLAHVQRPRTPEGAIDGPDAITRHSLLRSFSQTMSLGSLRS
jgi:hypothetical protein